MSRPPATRKNPFAWIVATILLLAAVAASFWVPLYARKTPKLGDFPFFYWYQLLLVIAVAIVSWVAYLLLRPPSGARARRDLSDAGEVSAAPPPAGNGAGPGATR